MNKGLKTGLLLFAFSLICGLLLAVSNKITSPIIEAAKLEKVQTNLKEFYSGSEYEFTVDNVTSKYTNVSEIYVIKKNGEVFANAYLLTATGGYGGNIELLVVVEKEDLKLAGLKVISHSETKGIGSKIVDEDFNVVSKPLSSLDDNFEGITGATVSSKAVKRGLKLALKQAQRSFGA